MLKLSQKNQAHINYRDSKLTRALKPSLENGKVAIICCINPSYHQTKTTRETLKFAARAKKVKTNTTCNTVCVQSKDATVMSNLRLEVEELKLANDRLKMCLELEESKAVRSNKMVDDLQVEIAGLKERNMHLTRQVSELTDDKMKSDIFDKERKQQLEDSSEHKKQNLQLIEENSQLREKISVLERQVKCQNEVSGLV